MLRSSLSGTVRQKFQRGRIVEQYLNKTRRDMWTSDTGPHDFFQAV